jgi:DNA-binding beta-propeller fold protein YncE
MGRPMNGLGGLTGIFAGDREARIALDQSRIYSTKGAVRLGRAERPGAMTMTGFGQFERSKNRAAPILLLASILCAPAGAASADDVHGFLETIHKHTTLTSTVPDNGDLNPYAIIVAPVSAGAVQKDDVLIDNFNNSTNLQGLGTTIVDYNPATNNMTLFAQLPRHIDGCPGGVGLSTAMAMLKTGWVIVGSTPSEDGTAGTKGSGCLIVLDAHGKLAGTLTGANIDDPWGNMAVIDKGASATLFLSNAGFGVGSAEGAPPVVREATVTRIELSIPDGKPPVVVGETVIGNGFGAQADKGVFLIGPTGLTLGQDGTTLYVSDAIDNRIVAIANATTRTDSAGQGREVTKDGFLKRPLAMVMAPNGHLLVTNALNGQVVEVDPASGKQLYARWIDTNRAQTPPGNGDLFGIAMTPAGDGFYYVEDDMNTMVLAR